MQRPLIPAAVDRFVADESGQTSVEYAIMAAFIILVCFASIILLSEVTRDSFNNTATAFQTTSN